MANEIEAGRTIESTTHIPIAELNDRIPEPATRSVRAIVTLTWPYSSAAGSIAFLLAEPDFRLRRSKGQVRVQFSGSSAKQVANAGIASGDEVTLCLDGVEWMRNEAEISTPGRGVDYELKFTERLLLQFQQEESLEEKLIDIDHPAPEPEAPVRIHSPEPPASTSPSTTSIYSRPADINGNEWSSPAFIKRARTSYGSFYENDYDPYTEEDGTVRGKGRKKTRLSSTWRYSSRSPTPELDPPSIENSPVAPKAPPPVMTDEGCQTMESELGDAAEALADFSRQATNVYSTPRVEATSLLEDQTNGQPEVRPGTQNSVMPPPTIQTQFTPSAEISPFGIQTPGTGAPLLAPQSPQLRPIASDALPLISPLVSSKFGLLSNSLNGSSPKFSANTSVEQTVLDVESVTTAKQTAGNYSPVGAPQQPDEDPEDLYGVSPIGRHGQSQLHPNIVTGDIHESNGMEIASEEQFASEDQYGHWQIATAQLGQSVSTLNAEGQVEEQRDDIYVEGEEDSHFGNAVLPSLQNDGLPMLDDQDQPMHRYPGPDDELHVPSFTNQWFPDHNTGSVAYPDLPPPEHETKSTHRQSPHPQALYMSRSQSAQSEIVDLTESDDEQQEEPLEDEDGDEISEGSEEEAPYLREGPSQSRHFPSNGADVAEDRDSQGSREDDDFDDDEIGPDRQYPRYQDGEEDLYDEDEEGSYDEEEMDEEEPRPAQPRSPVVIDLLSSDEEDAGEKPAGKPAPLMRSSQQREYSRDDEEIKSEESDDENFQVDRLEPSATGFDPLGREHSEESDDEEMASDDEDAEDIEYVKDVSDADSEILGQTNDISIAQQELSDSEIAEGSDEDQSESPEPEWTGISEPVHEMEEVMGDGDPSKLNFQQEYEYSGITTLNASGQENSPPSITQASRDSPPSILNEFFSMDGANDSRTEVLYPVLDQNGSSVIISSFEPHSQTIGSSENQGIESGIMQLPTPDDTQLSRTIASQVSFSFTTGQQPVADLLQDSSSTQVQIDPALQDSVYIANEPENVNEMEDVSFVEDDIELAGMTETEEGQLQHTEKTPDVEGDIEMGTVIGVDESSLGTEGKQREEVQLYLNLHAPEDNTYSSGDILITFEEAKDEETGGATMADDDAPELETAETPKAQTNMEDPSSNVNESPVTTGDSIQEVHDGLSVPTLGGGPVINEEPVQVSPRRSQRIGKPASSTADSEIVPPSTPTHTRKRTDPKNAQYDTLSPPILNDSSTPSGHDPSIEMALSALDSPQKQPHDLRRQPVVDLKVRLSRALRTELPDFTSLKVLRYHLNEKLDVLAIATTTPDEPQRSKGGPRNFQMTFNITDPSIAPSGVTEIQILRPYKEALPVLSAGDGILLRNFQVIAMKDKGFALRSGQSEGSSWAVFKDGEDDADVRGPPVEYGAAEKKYFVSLMEWFRSLDSVATAKLSRANANKAK